MINDSFVMATMPQRESQLARSAELTRQIHESHDWRRLSAQLLRAATSVFDSSQRTLTVALIDERPSRFSCYNFHGPGSSYDLALLALPNERSSGTTLGEPRPGVPTGPSPSWNETSANWECEYRFVFDDVVDAPFYQITTDTKSWGPFSYDELAAGEWRRQIRLPLAS